MKIAIITARIGNTDTLSKPSVVYDCADYYAFTDKNVNNSIWNCINPTLFSTVQFEYSNRRDAKIYKILPNLFLPDYDYYFWVDPTHDVLVNPVTIINDYLKDSEIAVFKHRERNCIFNEATTILQANKENKNLMIEQMNFYADNNMPKQFGLFELPAFVRKNSQNMTKLCLCWWEQICKFSARDQLSLPFVLWKFGITPSIMPGLVNGWDVKHLQSKLITQTRAKG